MKLLMKTIHGSRLYGLAHAGSDKDTFEVWSGIKTRQTIVGDSDVMRVSYDDFVKMIQKGVPQSLEALYSPCKDVNLLPNIIPGHWTTVNTYLRTIKSFWRVDPAEFKKRRHSARLAWNLQEFMEYGYFNPVLSPEAREWCEQYAIAGQGYWKL